MNYRRIIGWSIAAIVILYVGYDLLDTHYKNKEVQDILDRLEVEMRN